jgi:hypothetical protein
MLGRVRGTRSKVLCAILDADISTTRPAYPNKVTHALFQQHLAVCVLLANIILYINLQPTANQNTTAKRRGFPSSKRPHAIEGIYLTWNSVSLSELKFYEAVFR